MAPPVDRRFSPLPFYLLGTLLCYVGILAVNCVESSQAHPRYDYTCTREYNCSLFWTLAWDLAIASSAISLLILAVFTVTYWRGFKGSPLAFLGATFVMLGLWLTVVIVGWTPIKKSCFWFSCSPDPSGVTGAFQVSRRR
jgi:hypothetical protein